MARLWLVALIAVVGALALVPASASAKTCSDYSNQAAAQRAADTRDGDGDGIYCESLPCPCSTTSGKPATGAPKAPPEKTPTALCSKPKAVQKLRFSAAKYPHIRAHFLRAIRKGWPRILVLHRRHASERRDRVLSGIPTKPGFDRDEYPPAVGRETAKADVEYVGSHENRSHGSSMGAQLSGLCAGTRFRYVFF